jgi:hypothetical protein
VNVIRHARDLGKGLKAYARLLFGKNEYKRYNVRHNFLRLFSRKPRDDFYWSFYTVRITMLKN